MTKSPVPSITPELLDGVRSFHLDIIRKALLMCAAPALLLLLLGLRPEARGLALGALFATAEFRLSGVFSLRQFKGGKGSRRFLSVTLRFAFLAVLFIVAIKWEAVSLATTVAGVFSIKAILYFEYLIRRRGDSLGTSSLNKKG